MIRRNLLLETCEDRILCSATPSVTLSAPATSKLGDTVTVKANFSNASGTNAGYGPYIDLLIDKTGADGNDGLSFSSATYLGQAVTATTLTFNASNQATHPYAKDAAGNALVITAPAGYNPGDQLIVLQLPFGSFTPQQPAATIDINLAMSNLADANVGLPISARGGFQYGNDALNNPTSDPSIVQASYSNASIVPTLFTIKNTYIGPEDETATGPNYLRQYQVDVDIASGQTISNLQITDLLPANLQFYTDASHPVDVLLNGSPSSSTATATPSTTTPGGTLTRTLASVTGDATTAADATLRFWFYVPRVDSSSAAVINASTGDDTLAANNASTSGTWTPFDPRDTATVVTLNPAGAEHTLTNKSIATQKSVTTITDAGVAGLSPGDVLEYTIQVQVSDYFAFDDLVLTDILSDGQHLDQSFTPTLTYSEHGNVLGTAALDTDNWVASQNYTGAVANGQNYVLDPATNDGTTTITFRMSDEMITRGADGNLVGGGIPNGGTGAGALPNQPALPYGATTATVKFRVVVQDKYSDKPSDPQLSPRDVITNNVTVDGSVLNVSNLTENGNSEADTSGTSLAVQQPVLTKTIYAINGTLVSGNATQVIRPGDLVTYRLQYTIPTGDIDQFYLTDFLPLPVFDVSTFNLTYSNAAPSTTAPPANTLVRGSTDTFTSITGLSPTISEPGGNAVQFNYGSYSNTTNSTLAVDLMFTVVVDDQPFADGLYLTNQARATEGIARTGVVDTDAIVPFSLGEPDVAIYKGVVGKNTTGTTLGGIVFAAPTSAASFTGTIDSTAEVTAIDGANGTGVDANDVVRFAIVARNIGRSDAYDVSISDRVLGGYDLPATIAGLNLVVRRGDGTLLVSGTDYNTTYDNTTGQFSVNLVDNYNKGAGSGSLNFGKLDAAGTASTDGSNVIVVMYDTTLTDTVRASAVETNTAALTNYSNVNGGTDFTATDLTATATVTTTAPTVVKQITTTETIDPRGNAQFGAVIGETVTFTLTVNVPEGTMANAILTDTLDNNLSLVAVDSIVSSSGVTYTGTPLSPTVSNSGRTVAYNFGTITDSNNSNGTGETITITYRAVVLDVIGNQAAGTIGSQGASLAYQTTDFNAANPTGVNRNTSAAAAAPTQKVSIVEPTVNTAISATVNGVGGANPSGDAGDPVVYTITLTHGGSSTDAFDVDLSDVVPSLVDVTSFSVSDSAGIITSSAFSLAGNTLSTVAGGFDFTNIAGRVLTITINGSYDNAITAGTTVTNSATTKWTTLDGTIAARSSYDATSLERTGADGLPGAGVLNDYRSTASVSTSTAISAVKSIASTSESSTSGSNVAVGEIVRYRLITRIGEGDTADVRMLDNLPPGMTFLDDGTAKVAFVSNTAAFTSSSLAGAGLSVSGNESSVNGVVPTFALDDAAVSASSSSDVDTYAPGTAVYFKLGDLSVGDRDADQEFVVIEFNAIVSNNAATSNNAAGAGGSDAGDVNSNTYTVFRNANVNLVTSNSVPVTVVEPKVTIAKAVTQAPVDAGDQVTYTITLSNAGPGSTANAYDLLVRDLLDNDITLVSVSDSLGRGSYSTSTVSGQTQIDYTLSRLDLNESVVITVTGTLKATASAGETIGNSATVTYTSLPGGGTANGSPGNATGSTAGAAGSDTGERTGSGTAPNDYTASSATVNITLAQPTIDKLDLTRTTYSVGEQVVYFLNITLPEGVTEALEVHDFLPTGLIPVSYQVLWNGTATGTTSTPTANFSGSQFVTELGTVGDNDIDLFFSDLTVPADNNSSNNNFLIRVVAQVADIGAATNGAVLSNLGQLSYRRPDPSATTDPVTGTVVTQTDSTNITVTEPKLQIHKTVSDSAPEIGQTVQYTLTISHAAGSTAGAYDLIVRDTMPAGLTLLPGTVTYSAGVNADTSTSGQLALSFDQLAVGNTITVTYQAVVSSSASTVGQTLDNHVNLYWDSLAADDSNAVLSGSGDGAPDRDYGPTPGYTEGIAHSPDDPAQDVVRVTVNAHAVSGTVYSDVNRNGVFDAGDPGLSNVTVTLTGTDLNGNAVSLTQNTNASGAYTFANLPAGTYTLAETQPAGYVDGLETVGSNYGGTTQAALDSNTIAMLVIPNDGAASGTGYNFGETQTAGLAGRVYSDLDNSGTFSAGESGIANAGVAVTGTDSYGQAVNLTTTTNASGNYSFVGLRPGTYTITETQPAAYLDGKETAGTGTTTAGTINNAAVSNTISNIVLRSGESGVNNLFGELLPASLSGRVYRDLDNDGLVGASEGGVANVDITLTGVDDRGNNVSTTVQTNATGDYTFTSLRPGTYLITETQPAGLLDGKETAGGGVTTAGTVNNAVNSNTISTVVVAAGQNGSTNNFGELPPSSFAGVVYRDDNLNGIVDPLEVRLAGVTLTLTGTDDRGQAVNLAATTLADGSYSFTALRPGLYTIAETQPAGYVDGRDTAGSAGGTAANPPGDAISAITLPSNNDGVDYNFGEVAPASISGSVYNDQNNDGIRQGTEAGLAGVQVQLTGKDAFGNAVSITKLTNATGDYSFTDLAPSDPAGYTITELAPPAAYLDGRETAGTAGGEVVNDSDSQTITKVLLGQGFDSTDNNFGELDPSSLTGVVYRDLNNDGIRSGAGETSISGVTITLTGIDDRGDVVSTNLVTDASGAYAFNQLRPSDGTGYTISETQPTVLLDGQNTVGTQGGSTSNNPLSDEITTTVITAGTNGTGNNFGELPPASLAGSVFRDDNNDGVQQAGEPPLANVSLQLTGVDDLGDAVSLTTNTSALGQYLFDNLRPGTYTVSEVQPAGLLDGQNTVGDAGGATVNNPLSDEISGATLVAGQSSSGYNFGELAPTSLAGVVYSDANNDGVVQAGETPLAGVAVTLTGTDDLGGSINSTVLTAADGTYLFDNLRPGTYQLTEAQPVGYLDGRNTVGNSTGSTTNNPLSDIISAITLPSNTTAAGYNFGELAPSSLSGQVYLDLNGNGLRDAGESAVPGVTVKLTGVDDLGQAVNLTAQTQSDGSYSFTDLRPTASGYTLTETQPANYTDGVDVIGSQGGAAGNDLLLTSAIVAGTDGTANDFSELLQTQLTKTLIGTSETSTAGSSVSIGEVIRYRLTATVPYGTLRDFQLQELLPSGLVYVDDGTAAVALVSADGASLTGSGVFGAGASSVGAPTTSLPGSAVSTDSVSADSSYASGSDVFFRLGDLVNSDTDATTLETVVIEFNARVVDQPSNQSGTALSNQFTLRFDTAGDGVADDQAQAGTPPPVVVNVVEPMLQISKNVDDPTPDIGQTVTFTLTISHTAGSTQDAFDLILRDTMPAGVTLDPSSVSVSGANIDAAGWSASSLLLRLDQLALNGTITITYQATVDNTLANVGGTFVNNARLYWDSLEADDALNTVADGGTDGTPDRDYGATPGYVEPGSPVVDDPAQDSEQLDANANTISGIVYRDNDSSGSFSAGDTLLGGVAVKLEGTSATGLPVSMITTTDINGVYFFDRLSAGSYTLTETQPAGYMDGLETPGIASPFGGDVSPALGVDTILHITIPAQSATTGSNYNFGETLTSSLSGNVYLDDDNDGMRDPTESGLAGIPILLTGTDIYGQGVSISGVTDATGAYSFSNLRPGTYTVTEDDSAVVAPGGFLDGRDTAGTSGGVVTGAPLKQDQVDAINLFQGTDATAYNFGELRPAALTGFVYVDANNDGSQGGTEQGMAGAQVTLSGVDDLNQVVNVQGLTLADGSFSFTGLRPGTYTLTETQPVAYGDGKDAAGTLGGTTTNDVIGNISVQANQSGSGYSFGERLNGITGKVYIDVDRNGTKGLSEPALGGVQITLRDSSNVAIGVTTSAADGSFSFGNLLAGDYTVEETQPVGYGSSTPDSVLVQVPAGGAGSAAFGETLATLSGRAYLDADHDGAYSAGDSGLGGVQVTLTGTTSNNQTITRTTSTAADGTYTFSDLLGGMYTMTETQPAGYADGAETVGSAGGVLVGPDSIAQAGLTAGTDATDYNFGEILNVAPGRGSISGVVFYDRNVNTAVDGGEYGIAGVKLTLRDNVGNVLATTTTGVDGSYAFSNLLPGSYSVTESQPVAYGSSTANLISAIAVNANQTTGAQNFGETSGSMAGSVYLDTNNNGHRDAGEQGIAGVTVTLTGTDYNSTAVNRTAITDVNGDYAFTELLGGTYQLQESQPAGLADGKDTAGSAGGTLGNDVVSNIGLGGGVNAIGYVFGEMPATVSGTVYLDAGRTGTQRARATEAGLANVELTLVDGGGQVVASTLTDSDGHYFFAGVVPGSYSIVETQPNGYGSSTANALDVTVPANGLNGVDFGETLGSLAGRVYFDADQSGVYSAGESGLGGVVITLTGNDVNNQAVTLTTTTAADGSYLFDGLLGGNYTVRETQPGSYLDGADTLGSVGGTNSANDEFSGLGLGDGVVAVGYNFGETLVTPPGQGAIAGTVYVDRNRSQVLDGAEPGLGGVFLQLQDENGVPLQLVQTSSDGSFVFNGVAPGTGYQILEVQPAGYGSSTADFLVNIAVQAGEVTTNQNFGETLGLLAGHVYVDQDQDGAFTGSDRGLSGVQIHLTGTDVNSQAVDRTISTAADGSYRFDDLLAGTYTVQEIQPAAYLDGQETVGTAGGTQTLNDAMDVSLNAGDLATGYEFGEVGAQITGTVYYDRDQSATMDAGETPVGGVTLQLQDAQGKTVGTVVSQPDGTYQFTNLALGDYTIVETQPAAYGSSTPNVVPVTLATPLATVDFGETMGSLSGTVYHDLNYNGVMDVSEPLLGNVTVTLTGTDINGQAIALSTITDNLGQYGFGDLPTGTYTLTETQPAGYMNGMETPGTAGGNPSTVNVISSIGIGAGRAASAYLFGERTQTDLVMTKDDGLTTVVPGQKVTYTMTLQNAGLQEANGVIVSDKFPSDLLIFESASNGGVYDAATRTITWQLGQVTGNGQEVITLTVTATVKKVIPAGAERLTNEVTAVDDGTAGPDMNPDDNTAKDTDKVKAAPDLHIQKTDNLTQAVVGQQTTYVITGSNTGNQVAADVVVTDTLPPGVRFVSASNGGKLLNGQVVWNLGNLVPGQSFSLTVTVVVEVPAAGTTLTNTVTISERSANFEDPTPGDNTATDLTSVPSLPESYPLYSFDSFRNMATEPFIRGFSETPSGFNGYHNPTDNYRPAALPLAPIYSGEADPGSTLVIVVYNANGDVIGEQTVMVDTGGNWMATFANSEVRDYPASVSIVELPAPFTPPMTAGRNLRNYFAPVLNPGQFSFGGQDTTPLDPRVEAPLLGTLNLGNPLDLGNVKYGSEILPSTGGPGGR